MERTVIFYHGGCPDGFGGAFAAWKKFGDAAEYIPLSRSEAPPVETAKDATVYFIDFCYSKEIMDQFVAVAKSLTVIDHHEGVEDVIKSMPAFVYETEKSGAGLAWDYFHPETQRPSLINYVEDDDLFRFAIEDTKPFITYLEVQPQEFSVWDRLATALDGDHSRKEILMVAHAYREYFERLVDLIVDHAKLVEFEGHQVYFANAGLKTMKSLAGNMLARKQGPFSLVVSAHPEGYGVSIRGDGSVDVAKIAQKYGGNGHPNAAGFLIPNNQPMPWKLVEDAE